MKTGSWSAHGPGNTSIVWVLVNHSLKDSRCMGNLARSSHQKARAPEPEPLVGRSAAKVARMSPHRTQHSRMQGANFGISASPQLFKAWSPAGGKADSMDLILKRQSSLACHRPPISASSRRSEDLALLCESATQRTAWHVEPPKACNTELYVFTMAKVYASRATSHGFFRPHCCHKLLHGIVANPEPASKIGHGKALTGHDRSGEMERIPTPSALRHPPCCINARPTSTSLQLLTGRRTFEVRLEEPLTAALTDPHCARPVMFAIGSSQVLASGATLLLDAGPTCPKPRVSSSSTSNGSPPFAKTVAVGLEKR